MCFHTPREFYIPKGSMNEAARRIDELRSVILRAEEHPDDYPDGVLAEEGEYNELCAMLEEQGRL